MDFEESELDMARRHVAEGERHVRLQLEITEHLRALGASTKIAEELQQQFEELLVIHRQHLTKLEDREATGGATLGSSVTRPQW